MWLIGNWKEYCDELPPIYEVEDIYNVNAAEDGNSSITHATLVLLTSIYHNNDFDEETLKMFLYSMAVVYKIAKTDMFNDLYGKMKKN